MPKRKGAIRKNSTRNVITIDMVKEVYKIFKKIDCSEIDLKHGIKKAIDLGINKKSAEQYFKRLDYFINGGKKYRFSLNSEHLLYFLSQIHNDFDKNIYLKALSAVKETIIYYNGKENGKPIPKIYEDTYNLLIEKKIKINDVYSHYKNSNEEYLNKYKIKKNNNINKSNTVSSPSTPNVNEPFETISIKKQKEQLHEIIECIKDKIISINEICEAKNKEPIFDDTKSLKLWKAIEKSCASEEIFINFSLKLYILIYETTRKENQEYSINNGKPFYDFYLPSKFLKNGTSTKYFMDIVGTLRHKFAHKEREPEYNNVPIKKMKYKDVLREIFNGKTPKSSEDYQKLQIELLKRLDNVLEKLLKMIDE